MSLRGLIAFVSYIVHIYYRWARVTFRRYGLRGLIDASYRPKRAGVGYGVRANPFGRQHDAQRGVRVWYLLRQLEHERAALA